MKQHEKGKLSGKKFRKARRVFDQWLREELEKRGQRANKKARNNALHQLMNPKVH
jgi:flavin-dependent dehydrogenase